MASNKPQIAGKSGVVQRMSPALQIFMQKQQEAIEGTHCQDTSDSVGGKSAVGSVKHTVSLQEETTNNTRSVSKRDNSRAAAGDVKSFTGHRVSQVNVPEIFQQNNVNSKHVLSEKSRNVKNDNTKPFIKQDSQPAVSLKPLQGGGGANQAAAVAQSMTGEIKAGREIQRQSLGASSKFEPIIGSQGTNKMTHSINLSETTRPSSLYSSHAHCSPPASENGVTDFRSMLRPTKFSRLSQETEQIKKYVMTPSPVVPRVMETAEAGSANGLGKPSSALHPGSAVSVQENQSHRNIKSSSTPEMNNSFIMRESDTKKFKRVTLEVHFFISRAPPKPELPKDINLTEIKQQYQAILTELVQDPYDDASSAVDGQSDSNHQLERISLIPDISADEETMTSVYDDGYMASPVCSPPPIPARVSADKVYGDAASDRKEVEMNELYEGEVAKSEQEKKKQQLEKTEAKKREDKGKKKKEKDGKKQLKEEKERTKKEKEEIQLWKKFKLIGNETEVGEGIIKQDVKDLALKKGQTVTIVRLDQNPPNKWLIRTDAMMGYINSNIIEVDPDVIRQAMSNQKRNAKDNTKNDSYYDDVAHGNTDEDIYEECS